MATAALPVTGNIGPDGDAGGRGRPGRHLNRSQESALAALTAVATHVGSDEDLPVFFGRLAATVAQLTGARRAAFWRLGARGTLALQPDAHGFPEASPVHAIRLHLGARDNDVVERLVFAGELQLARGTCSDLDAVWRGCGLTDLKNSIAAAWTAGERHIGAVAVYDAPHGFTAQDVWMLRMAGVAAGLLWHYKESEDELDHMVVRLEDAMAARRHLLNNIAAGGDEARRRFAIALHDDSLQLLTGAELQLERIRVESAGNQAALLEQLHETLRKVEESLRQLLTQVSPEALQLPSDLRGAIRERLESLRVRAGIETNVDVRIPDGVPQAIQGIVIKNIAEALSNVEKHARATRVTVIVESLDGGLRVDVSDNGTGFVIAESIRTPGRIGLVALRERAQLAGGWCRIESDPGTGTRIDFWIPLTP